MGGGVEVYEVLSGVEFREIGASSSGRAPGSLGSSGSKKDSLCKGEAN